MGTYRAALKAPDRLVVRMATRVGGAGGYVHWKKHKAKGEELPCAIVLGCPPLVAFMGPQKLRIDLDEFDVAGGLAGEPINVVRGKTVDLLVPAEAELVIEGVIDTGMLEPEGPFGESHGHVALEEFNMPMRVTAITRKAKPVIPSYISQVAPSESSVIKRVAYEPLFLGHLRGRARDQGGHRRFAAREADRAVAGDDRYAGTGAPRTEVWRALYGAASFKGDCSKICIAVNDDIDPDNADALLWAMAYRHNPVEDVTALPPSRAGPRTQAGAQGRGRLDPADRRHDEVADAALGAAHARLHGGREGALGTVGPAQAQARIAVARLFPRRLVGRLGTGGTAGR